MALLDPRKFQQKMDETAYDVLPKFATYEGAEPSLAAFLGVWIPTHEVEMRIPIGERENVAVYPDEGGHSYPWRYVDICSLDADGEPMTNVEPLPDDAGEGYAIGDINRLGYTEAQLVEMARDLLGEVYEPQRPGPSLVREAVFKRVLEKLYADE